MASYYSQYGRLRAQTEAAYTRCFNFPDILQYRIDFYLAYLQDVVPYQISVHVIPSHRQPYELHEIGSGRVEIDLYYGGYNFMTCVVSLDSNPYPPEEVAATLAFEHWRHGHCLPDPYVAWRMMTGLSKIRFCQSRDGRDWDRMATLHPIGDVRAVVGYFRQEFERARLR